MDAFQVVVSLNMTLWSVVALVAFVVFYQRGRIQPQTTVGYTTIKDEITVEALAGNVHRTIAQYRTVGYEPTKIVSRGNIQRITLFKNVNIPTGGTR